MELESILLIAALVLLLLHLLQRSSTPSNMIVVMPSTAGQDSGLGCAAFVLSILLAVIVLAVLGLLP